VANLSEGIEDLAARLPPVTRRNLRIAQRRGVRIEVDRDGCLLPIFRRLYRASVGRWAAKQNEPVALARWRAAGVSCIIGSDGRWRVDWSSWWTGLRNPLHMTW